MKNPVYDPEMSPFWRTILLTAAALAVAFLTTCTAREYRLGEACHRAGGQFVNVQGMAGCYRVTPTYEPLAIQ